MDVLRYTCSKCGEEHEGLPDMAFRAPMYFDQIPEAERGRRAVLTSDTCVIDEEDFFVRGCLAIPIQSSHVSFVWGVWVSLSEKNFRRYVDFFDTQPPPGEGPYFGWLSNQLPGYSETFKLKTHVVLQQDGQRPTIELEPNDHPLAVHQRAGMPLAELLAILGDSIHAPVVCHKGTD